MESLKSFRGGPAPRLQECIIRPSLGGRGRRAGTLELHANGVRYKSAQNAPLDITFANIKHSFFQVSHPAAIRPLLLVLLPGLALMLLLLRTTAGGGERDGL